MSGKLTSKKKGAAPPGKSGKTASSPPSSSTTAPLKPEDRMNLTALKRRDPYIVKIIDTASQVALYVFNEPDDAWEKTDVEGTLFVYERSAAPFHGLTISNRKMPRNHWETINSHVEFQQQDPFLLYKNKDRIFGIWFFDAKECKRVGDLVSELTKKVQNEPFGGAAVEAAVAITSNSAATLDATLDASAAPANARIDASGDKHGIVMKDIIEGHSVKGGDQTSDIIALLSKAQREYDAGLGGIPSTDGRPGTKTKTDDVGHNDNNHHHNNHSGGPVSISVSSLFATANGRRLTQGDLEEDNDSNNNRKDAVPSNHDSVQRQVAVVPKVARSESAEEKEDVLQCFVRKMNINGIQSLDPSAMIGPHRPPSSGINPLIPRPLSLSMSKNDSNNDLGAHNAGGPNHSDTVSTESDVAMPVYAAPEPAPRVSSPPERPRAGKGDGHESPPEEPSPRASHVGGSSSSTSASGKSRHRNSVPSFSPPSCKRLPPIPAHFTSSAGSGLASASSPNSASSSSSEAASSSSPTPSVFGASQSRAVPLLTPSAFESDSDVANRQLGHLITGGRKSDDRKSRSSRPIAFYYDSDAGSSPARARVDQQEAVALTKEQLRVALVHLLKSDDDFVDSIHRAYVESLTLRRSFPNS